jgi:hypothetical protein
MLDDTYVKFTDNFNKKTRRYATNDRAIDRHLSTMWESMADCIDVFTETETPSIKKKEAKDKFDTAQTKLVASQQAQVTSLITEVIAGIMPAIAKQTTDIIESLNYPESKYGGDVDTSNDWKPGDPGGPKK